MRKRSSELVIHITSIGEFSFLFYFTIFPHLQFTAGEFENFIVRQFSPVLIFTNNNPFGSLVFVGFLLVVCS